MRASRPDTPVMSTFVASGDRAAIGAISHSRARFQRETAQPCGASTLGLPARRKSCNRWAATRCSRVATHLFQSLDLEGQARAPIRGLPAFFAHLSALHTLAEPRHKVPSFRQSAAGSVSVEIPSLQELDGSAISVLKTQQSRKGTLQCRQITSRLPSPYAAGFQPVGRQPANRSSTAPAQGRLARSCWTATLSRAPLSAPQQTSFTARKTPESADRTPGFLALTFRSGWAGSPTTQMPCPDVFRGRHLVFRPNGKPGPTRKQGTANV